MERLLSITVSFAPMRERTVMPYSQDEMPRRLDSEKLVLEELQDELMIYDPERHKAFCLNQSASFVWKHIDGNRTVAEITDLMGQHFGKRVPEEVVWFALDVLAKDGLLAAPIPSRASLTRRTLLQKFSVGAAAAVPVVTVLFVSPVRAHASSVAARRGSSAGFFRNGFAARGSNLAGSIRGIARRWF
jgi:hypothetical protein